MKFFSFIAFTFLSFGLIAQTSAKVKYTETVSFDIPEEVRSMMRDMPSSTEIEKILNIKDNESVYVANKEDVKKEENSQGSGNRRMFFRGRSIDAILYKNIETETQIHFKDLFEKEFLVTEEYKSYPWKIVAREQRDILGYACMKAELKDTTNTVAWFTTQIPLSFGPGEYHGLPGLILALSVGEKRVILAKSVELSKDDITIEIPSKGEKISAEQFDKLAEEKRKEMEKMWGGNRRRMGRM